MLGEAKSSKCFIMLKPLEKIRAKFHEILALLKGVDSVLGAGS